MIRQSLHFILFCVRQKILYQIVVDCQKEVVHFIDEENMVTYVDCDCGITFFPETPKKRGRSTENGITFPDPVKNRKAFPARINTLVLLISSKALLSF